MREREVLTSPGGSGRVCDSLQESQNCNPEACEANCHVSQFSDWSLCAPIGASSSAQCSRNRSRTISKEPTGSGNPCPNLMEHENCDCSTTSWGTDVWAKNSSWLTKIFPILALLVLLCILVWLCCKCFRRRRRFHRTPRTPRHGEREENKPLTT